MGFDFILLTRNRVRTPATGRPALPPENTYGHALFSARFGRPPATRETEGIRDTWPFGF
jgi:hypothetical protein